MVPVVVSEFQLYLSGAFKIVVRMMQIANQLSVVVLEVLIRMVALVSAGRHWKRKKRIEAMNVRISGNASNVCVVHFFFLDCCLSSVENNSVSLHPRIFRIFPEGSN